MDVDKEDGNNAVPRAVPRARLALLYRALSAPHALTAHHVTSMDVFLSRDLPALLAAQNPLTKGFVAGGRGEARRVATPTDAAVADLPYQMELYVGGTDGRAVYVDTPAAQPELAKARCSRYLSRIAADVLVVLTARLPGGRVTRRSTLVPRHPLAYVPALVPAGVGRNADPGGYLVLDGGREVAIVSKQQQAHNVFHVALKAPTGGALPSPTGAATVDGTLITAVTSGGRELPCLLRLTAALANGGVSGVTCELPRIKKAVPVVLVFKAMGVGSDAAVARLVMPEAAPPLPVADAVRALLRDGAPFHDGTVATRYLATLTKQRTPSAVLSVLHTRFLTHLDTGGSASASASASNGDAAAAALAMKALELGRLVRRLLDVATGALPPTDRDDARNQRCWAAGALLGRAFTRAYLGHVRRALTAADRLYNKFQEARQGVAFLGLLDRPGAPPGSAGALLSVLPAGALTAATARALAAEDGALQPLARLSALDTAAHLRRATLDVDVTRKSRGPRQLHPSQDGFVDPWESPSGSSIGIVRNLAAPVTVSDGWDATPLRSWLHSVGDVVPLEGTTAAARAAGVRVLVNGGWTGVAKGADAAAALVAALRALKRYGCVSPTTSIALTELGEVSICTDGCRLVRPLQRWPPTLGADADVAFTEATSWLDAVIGAPRLAPLRYPRDGDDVPHPHLHLHLHLHGAPGAPALEDPLERSGTPLHAYPEALAALHASARALARSRGEPVAVAAIEYVDPSEQAHAYIAWAPTSATAHHTHVELHPAAALGVVSATLPWPQHNPAPRNHLACAQSKQALGEYAPDWRTRFDDTATHVLVSPQAPLVVAGPATAPYGTNTVVAILSVGGHNQEDAFLMNAAALARGAFASCALRSYKLRAGRGRRSGAIVRIANPALCSAYAVVAPGRDYSQLDERGVIRQGATVGDATVLIALGDKFSTRAGQKGTLGRVLPPEDMPRTASGVIPDMVINPHAVPSRMTVSLLMEAVAGKTAAATGRAPVDATPWVDDARVEGGGEHVGDDTARRLAYELAAAGFHPMGTEVMYSGIDGTPLPVATFVGPVYVTRLKHMAEDKAQARGPEGRVVARTRQPGGGRARDGGLRFGEMEVAAAIAHCAADFVQEKLNDCSDGFALRVCDGCGSADVAWERHETGDGDSHAGRWVCCVCEGPLSWGAVDDRPLPRGGATPAAGTSRVAMPYAFHLLAREAAALAHIDMRYVTANHTRAMH